MMRISWLIALVILLGFASFLFAQDTEVPEGENAAAEFEKGAVVKNPLLIFENENWKIGLDELTGCVLFDVNEEHDEGVEVLLATKVSLIQWKRVNLLEVGMIGKEELKLDRGADIFLGASFDISPVKFDGQWYIAAGIFASPGLIDDGAKRYGGYLGIGKDL